jgi:TRAP-type C4-dicarboxylate transport system permease small subunit
MSMAVQKKVLTRLLHFSHAVEDSFLVILLAAMIGLAVLQIILRNLFDSGLPWIDPLLQMLVLWVGLAGAMIATRMDHHISIDAFTRLLSPRLQLVVRIIVDLFTAIVTAIVAYHGSRLLVMEQEAESIAFGQIPVWVCELIIPLAFGVIALRYLIYAVILSRQLLNWRQT